MKLLLSIIFAMVFAMVFAMAPAATAFAGGGDIIGDGADILYCEDEAGRKITSLLDFDEGALRYGYVIQKIGKDGESITSRAAQAIDRLSSFAPPGAVDTQWLVKRVRRFFKETKWVGTDEGKQDDDRGDAQWTQGCQRERLVMRFPSLTSAGHRYAIEEPRWDDLSYAHQAGAVLHEAIYGYAKEILGHTDSERSRRMNAFLHSTKMNTITWQEFYEFGEMLGFCVNSKCFADR